MQGGGHREPPFFILVEASSKSTVQWLNTRYHWLFCPSFRVAQAAINEGPVAVLPAEVRLEEALFVLFLPELVRLLLLLEKFPTARARTPLLS